MASKGKKLGIGCGIFCIAVAGFVTFTPAGRAVKDLWNNGSLKALVFKPQQQNYIANNTSNLKAMHTALMLYHESEGQFPNAEGWMTAIENRLQSNDLKDGEGAQKLKNPASPQYGYGFNIKASAKFKEDLKDSAMILVFESESTKKNAFGDPAVDSRRNGSLGITLAGEVVKVLN